MVKKFFIPSKDNNYRPLLLRKVALVTYTAILLIVNTFGGFLGIPEAMASSITPANIIRLTNQQRTAAGLNSLSSNAKLAAAAQAKANNMLQNQYWDHYGPNGETPWMFISQAGYVYVYAGENLAKGFKTAEGVHEAWMASPTHKDNIMSRNYKEIGVAVVEGSLLGKETVLVVQMFGNRTEETYKPTTPPPRQTEPAKPILPEQGEIKSIKISNPKTGDLINDANINIKGETENMSGEYTVEIINAQQKVGETKSNTEEWEFDKQSDWTEGEQNIVAQIKGENIKSAEVAFVVDTTPPVISQETIKVHNLESIFKLTFQAPADAVEVQFVSGDKTHSMEIEEDLSVELDILKEDIAQESVLVTSDQAGNISKLDISEYFIREVKGEESESRFVMSIKDLFGTTDGISLLVVAFVFILLTIQVYVSWKKGKLSKNAGNLFTIGAWWLIILVAVFKGFGGIII